MGIGTHCHVSLPEPWASTTIKRMVDPIPMIETLRYAMLVILTPIVLMVVGIPGRGYTQKSSHQIQECLLRVHGLNPVHVAGSREPFKNGRLHQLRCQWFTYLPTYYHRNQPNVGKITIYGWYRNCFSNIFKETIPGGDFCWKFLPSNFEALIIIEKGHFFLLAPHPPPSPKLPGSFSFTRKKWRSGSTVANRLDSWVLFPLKLHPPEV